MANLSQVSEAGIANLLSGGFNGRRIIFSAKWGYNILVREDRPWAILFVFFRKESVEFLIICPALFLAGFVDAIGGGGGLISLPAFMLAGLPPHAVLATNKMSSTMGTIFSTAKYIRSGFVLWKLAIPGIIAAFVGSTIGSNLALIASETLLQWFMLFAMPAVGIYMLFKKDFGQQAGNKPGFSERKTLMLVVVSALLVGTYDGFYGPGTGTFMILALALLARLPMDNCAGIAKVVNLTSNVAALSVFLINGTVWLIPGLAGGVFCALGHIMGARVYTANGAKVARPIIIVMICLFTCKLVYDMFIA